MAVAADEPTIRHCAELAYGQYTPLIGRDPAPMVADFAADIAAGHVRIASDCGEFRGYATFFPDGAFMHLESVAVHPAHAGRGIGRQLIEHCEHEARIGGYDGIRLYTNEVMSANLKLYPRLGYAEIERRREDGFNRVFFEKRLPD